MNDLTLTQLFSLSIDLLRLADPERVAGYTASAALGACAPRLVRWTWFLTKLVAGWTWSLAKLFGNSVLGTAGWVRQRFKPEVAQWVNDLLAGLESDQSTYDNKARDLNTPVASVGFQQDKYGDCTNTLRCVWIDGNHVEDVLSPRERRLVARKACKIRDRIIASATATKKFQEEADRLMMQAMLAERFRTKAAPLVVEKAKETISGDPVNFQPVTMNTTVTVAGKTFPVKAEDWPKKNNSSKTR